MTVVEDILCVFCTVTFPSHKSLAVCVCACACDRVCVCACVRVCVRAFPED